MLRGSLKKQDIAHTRRKALTLASHERTNNKACNKVINGKQVNWALFKPVIVDNYVLRPDYEGTCTSSIMIEEG